MGFGMEMQLDLSGFWSLIVSKLVRFPAFAGTPKIMNKYCRIMVGLAVTGVGAMVSGCQNEYYAGSPYHPGPQVGMAVGTGAGVVAGNVAGVGVGAVQGTVEGAAASMDPSYKTVTRWRTETTSDGRSIQVPYTVMVDRYGRPVNMPAPGPSATTTAATNAPSK